MNALELIVLALAVSRIARLIVSDAILDKPREWVLRRYPGATTEFGDTEVVENGTNTFGRRIGYLRTTNVPVFKASSWFASEPRFVGNVISCTWCTGVWVAIATWLAYWFYPDLVYWVAPLALAEVAGLLNDR